MGIDYKFNEWRISGGKAEAWSPMAYNLLSKNINSDAIKGFRIGHILYLHHIKGLSAKEIRQTPTSCGLNTNKIKSILRGFGSQSGVESKEAYQIAMYMIKNEPDVLKRMYQINRNKL